jgi:hypothetical protein
MAPGLVQQRADIIDPGFPEQAGAISAGGQIAQTKFACNFFIAAASTQ